MVFNRKSAPYPSEAPAAPRPAARPASIPTAGGEATASVIGSDLSIDGQCITIRCKGSLTVLGNIEADVHSGRLEVGKDATVQGTVAADTVSIFGRVNGSIMGTHVTLHSTAEVEGDIHSHLLAIEQGASFDGLSRRVADPSEIVPQVERPQVPVPGRGAQSSLGSRLHS